MSRYKAILEMVRRGVSTSSTLWRGKPLGTAGALKNAERYLNGTFLVLNGDTYLEIDVEALITSHRRRRAANQAVVATIALLETEPWSNGGVVELGNGGRILSFTEKPPKGHSLRTMSTGIYIMEPAILDFIPSGRSVSLEREIFPRLLQDDLLLLLCGYLVKGFFVDMGTPEEYNDFVHYIEALMP